MTTKRGAAFTDLTDDELVTAARRLATVERHATAALIRSLIEIDARQLYRREGCASLYTFCTQVLHLCEGATYTRIEIARAARDFPAMLDALEEGTVTLTALRMLAPHLNESNRVALLEAAKHKSKREVEELVAAVNPQSDVPATVRELPQDIRALAPERYEIRFTIGRETRDKLSEVQDLLRHSIVDGDLEEIFDRAVTLLLKKAQRDRFAETSSPRRCCGTTPSSRYIPAAVRRAVWRRDQGRCRFVGPRERCSETTLLQFHHKIPFAAGGACTVENIELRCAAHNRYEAELYFGAGYPGLVRERSANFSHGCSVSWPDRELVLEQVGDWHEECAIHSCRKSQQEHV